MLKKSSTLQERLYEAMKNNGVRAVDIYNELGISKSAISQYLSGRLISMEFDRLYQLSEYLDVSEAWLLGYDVPRARITTEITDGINDVNNRMLNDADFSTVVHKVMKLPTDALKALIALL